MQHYRPFEKFWYVQRSIDNNPLRNGLNPDRSNGLESIVDVTSPNKDNGEHKSLLGYVGSTLANGLGYAGSVADNIFSVVPSSVKKFALAGSLAGLLYVAVACGGSPTLELPIPEKQEHNLIQSGSLNQKNTYRIIFPFREPSTPLEEGIVKTVEWMESVYGRKD